VAREHLGQFIYSLFQRIAAFYELIHFISRNVDFSRKKCTLELKGTHHVNKDNVITLDIAMKCLMISCWLPDWIPVRHSFPSLCSLSICFCCYQATPRLTEIFCLSVSK